MAVFSGSGAGRRREMLLFQSLFAHAGKWTRKVAAFLGIIAMLLRPVFPLANPQDGVVSAGSATITSSTSRLDIHQSSDKAIIDWRSFNIDHGETTQFHQPSSSSITLNRVNDTRASTIDGFLKANGHIMVLNPNGIIFGQNSVIDVAGLTATTADIRNEDFMAGHMNFSQPGLDTGKIINNGSITAREAGLVSLVAPHVENNGLIQARLGKVNMGAGDTFTLDMAGDGLIQVAVSPNSAVGKKIVNTGSVIAEGGIISMTATSAREVVDSLTNNQSSATNMQIVNGQVSLIENKGTISVANMNTGKTGGQVNMFADDIALANNSTIDASGHSGGGEVYVGIDKDMRLARKLDIASGATLKADAGYVGNGGKVITWGARENNFQGHIQAKGGAEGGDGGFIEVSSHDDLKFNGTVDTTAPLGETGTLLLDPTNITISTNLHTSTLSSPYQPLLADIASNVNVGTLQTALASSNVTVQTLSTGSQAGTLTVVDPITWSSGTSLTLSAHSNLIINAAIAASGTLTLTADGDIAINAALTESAGSANLIIQPRTNSTSIGVAGGTGTINLSSTDLNNIQGTWDSITLGTTVMTGNMNLNAYTWNAPLTLRTSSGVITVDGAQNVGSNNLTITTNADPVINADLGGTGTLTVQQANTTTTMGLAGGTGTVSLTANELSHIVNGWTDIILGRLDSTVAINVNAATWNDNLTLLSNSGQMTIAGTQNMGANNLTLQTNNLDVSGALTGTGTLTIKPSGSNTTVGLAGGAGTLSLTTAELANITDGWSDIMIGRTDSSAAITVNAATWNDNLTLLSNSGQMTIAGTQTMGANNLTLNTASNLAVNGALTGTGTLTFYPGTTVMSMGINGATGTYGLSNPELANITDGWSNIILGRIDSTGAINMNGYSWTDPLTIRSLTGAITISGTQSMGSNNLTIETTNLAVNSGLNGTGTLTIRPSTVSSTVGLAGGAGGLNLTTTELGNITDGWSNIIIGRSDGSGNMAVNAATWNDALTLRSGSGTITIAGAQTMGANNLTFETDSNLTLSSTLTGTGALTIKPSTASTTIGLAGGAGTLALTTGEISNITDGWSDIIIGRNDGTGDLTANAATWNDPLTLRTGSGILTIAGTQTLGANNLTIETDSAFPLNAALSGSKTLTLRPSSVSTTIGVADGAGTFSITSAEMSKIIDGWSQIIIGRTDGTGNAEIGEATWNDPVQILTGGNITVNGTQTNAAGADTDMVFATINGSFINNAGANALDAGSGRYLVYSTTPNNNTSGGLTGFTRLYGKTYAGYGPDSVTETGNVFLYSIIPTLTVTADDKTREYGDANPALTTSYSGFLLGDDESILSGSPTLNTIADEQSITG
ncbi:MAG: filamentous hemagglutinin N-terminal domain-containing protein, partial [Pseudomonadota bacterium]|nr:filamentous hemagglutinin N-terminal domain-containing protein [Pseudomonadota bacterium]